MAFPASRVAFLPAASSAFSSFHSGHCSVQWLFQLPQSQALSLRHCSVQWLFQLPQWPFHLQGCPGDVFLTVPRLPPAPSKTSAPSPAASSGFASLSTCTALSLHFAPMSFSGTVSQALQRPVAFLAFTVGTAASSGFSSFHSGHLQGLSQALSLRHCSVEWLFQLPQWPFHLQGCPGDVFLTVPRLPPAPSKTFAPSPAASSGFASLSTCTALSLHFAPMSFSGTVSQALQRPLAFLAFTVGTAASSGFSSFHSGHLQGLSQALSLRHCSVQWLFQLPQWPFYLQGSVPEMSFLRFQDCRLPPPKPSHPPPQRPAALLAFRPARLCPCTLSSFSGTVSPGDVFLTVPRLPPARSQPKQQKFGTLTNSFKQTKL